MLEVVFEHLVIEHDCISKLFTSKQELFLSDFKGSVYQGYLWQFINHKAPLPPTGLFALTALSRYWRRRSLAVIFQCVLITDIQGYERDLVDHFCASGTMETGLCAVDHVQHLIYGWDVGSTKEEWCYDIEDHPWLELNKIDSDGEWSLTKEIDLACPFFELLPTTLHSIYWRSPLPIEGKVAEALQKFNFKDVFISSDGYYIGTSRVR